MKRFPFDLESFVVRQKSEWELADKNYAALSNIKTKYFEILGNKIIVQFNPERIKSSTAAVDKKSIQERNCFLCDKNRPNQQREIEFNQNYKLLLNPFPIFDPHFTISSNEHKSQLISSEFEDLNYFIDQVGKEYTIFYNGPECGASAPDHMHFQSCPRSLLPIEEEYFIHKKKFIYNKTNSYETEINLIQDGLRSYIGLEYTNCKDGRNKFDEIIKKLEKVDRNKIEPKINLVCFKRAKNVILIFPRQKHRPDYYFKNDDDKILISPAAVDIGGVIICPRENDFKKINEIVLIEIFAEICYTDEKFKKLLDIFNTN